MEEEYVKGVKNEDSVGEQIRSLRKQSGMTQEELGKELNVTRQALSNWERNVNTPDTDTLQRISFLFGVHMDDFVQKAMRMESSDKKGNGGTMENGVEKGMIMNMENGIVRKSAKRREKRPFNKYDMAIGLFYAVGICLGLSVFFALAGRSAAALGGVFLMPAFGMTCHAVITLTRKDR